HEYEMAKILPNMIETGAVIITGEAATKNNASEMVHHLSKEAGEFLVATAGPDLEGIIAAKGSGVFQQSKGNKQVRANGDIGGGIANIAVYQQETLVGTCTLHVRSEERRVGKECRCRWAWDRCEIDEATM